jgi:energy-coupling factor transporter transmembrane protein EcfT
MEPKEPHFSSFSDHWRLGIMICAVLPFRFALMWWLWVFPAPMLVLLAILLFLFIMFFSLPSLTDYDLSVEPEGIAISRYWKRVAMIPKGATFEVRNSPLLFLMGMYDLVHEGRRYRFMFRRGVQMFFLSSEQVKAKLLEEITEVQNG